MYPTLKFAPVDPSILPFMGVLLLPGIMGLSKGDALSFRLPFSAISCMVGICFFGVLTYYKIKKEREAGTPSQTSREASSARRAMGYIKYALRLWMSFFGFAIPMVSFIVLLNLLLGKKMPSLPAIALPLPMLLVTFIAMAGLLLQSFILDGHYNRSGISK